MVRSLVCLTVLSCLGVQAVPRAAESAPNYDKIRSALQRPVTPTRFDVNRASLSSIRPKPGKPPARARHDSVWNGALIGAGLGAAGGYMWAWNLCGPNDPECSTIVTPIGILAGAGIGGAIGAIADALHR
jgi:hypothetical protein